MGVHPVWEKMLVLNVFKMGTSIKTEVSCHPLTSEIVGRTMCIKWLMHTYLAYFLFSASRVISVFIMCTAAVAQSLSKSCSSSSGGEVSLRKMKEPQSGTITFGLWLTPIYEGQLSPLFYGGRLRVLSSHYTVLSTQQHLYTQCPSWFFPLERYRQCGNRLWDTETLNKQNANYSVMRVKGQRTGRENTKTLL